MGKEPAENRIKYFPASLEIKSGKTLYKVTSIYADKGDFYKLWESLIVDSIKAKMNVNVSHNKAC